jgi:hypothetical protein
MAALGLAPGCPDLLLDLAGLYKGRGLLAVRRGGGGVVKLRGTLDGYAGS